MKPCRKCKTEKPLSEFRKDAKNRDGYKNFCKSCCGTQQRQHRQTAVFKKKYRAYYRSYIPTYNFSTPDRILKHRARQEATLALKRGDIEKSPCIECGAPKAEMHHPDHHKALDIIWLCRPHHRVADQAARTAAI